jgi:hypothetical protein
LRYFEDKVVPKAGLEPALLLQKWILNPPRLPFRHLGLIVHHLTRPFGGVKWIFLLFS